MVKILNNGWEYKANKPFMRWLRAYNLIFPKLEDDKQDYDFHNTRENVLNVYREELTTKEVEDINSFLSKIAEEPMSNYAFYPFKNSNIQYVKWEDLLDNYYRPFKDVSLDFKLLFLSLSPKDDQAGLSIPELFNQLGFTPDMGNIEVVVAIYGDFLKPLSSITSIFKNNYLTKDILLAYLSVDYPKIDYPRASSRNAIDLNQLPKFLLDDEEVIVACLSLFPQDLVEYPLLNGKFKKEMTPLGKKFLTEDRLIKAFEINPRIYYVYDEFNLLVDTVKMKFKDKGK